MSNMIPQIGATGKYQLRAPFDTQVKENVLYTCIAVRRLSDFIENGRDPKALFYDANGLTDNDWAHDSADPDTCIATLSTKAGQWIYVPTSYIVTYPDGGGIPYTVRILGINLGAIPDTLDLSNLMTSIQNLVKDTIGIDSTAQMVAASETKLLTKEDSDAIESARLDLVTVNKTDYATNIALQNLVQDQVGQIEALQDYIASLGTPSP